MTTSTNQPNAATLLEFANVQIAAEALYGLGKPSEFFSSEGLSDETYKKFLTQGNNRTSRFTEIQANEFVQNWEIVSHIANTGTGFSGTLFKYIGQAPIIDTNNEGQEIKNGDLVISFRSTEFMDDAARDNQATNTFEIKNRGWAFGQIADVPIFQAA